MGNKRIIKEFKTQSFSVDLAKEANRFAEENNYRIVSMSSYVTSELIFTDGRRCTSWRYLTVLYENKDNLF